jgi:hypothetical protein
LTQKIVRAIRVWPEPSGNKRGLARFSQAIDRKLRADNSVRLKPGKILIGGGDSPPENARILWHHFATTSRVIVDLTTTITVYIMTKLVISWQAG